MLQKYQRTSDQPGRKSTHPICIYLRLVARDCFAGLHTMPSSCLLPAVDLWCDGVSCWRPPAAHVPLAWRTGQLWATKGPRGVSRMKWSLRNGLGIKGAGLVFVRGGIGLLLVRWLSGVQNSLVWYIHDHIWTSSSAVVKLGRVRQGHPRALHQNRKNFVKRYKHKLQGSLKTTVVRAIHTGA